MSRSDSTYRSEAPSQLLARFSWPQGCQLWLSSDCLGQVQAYTRGAVTAVFYGSITGKDGSDPSVASSFDMPNGTAP